MAELDTYSLTDLVGIEKDRDGCNVVMPGKPVRHKDDAASYGMCVSRRWIWDDKPMQCEVLWSKQPRLVKTYPAPIYAPPPVPRRTQWSTDQTEDVYGNIYSGQTRRRQEFEVEEEYENLTYDEIRKFHENERADVQLHSDGRVTVKYKTHEPPSENDARIRNRSFSVRR